MQLTKVSTGGAIYTEAENPKMLEIYVNQAWHNVFCYAEAHALEEGRYNSLERKLLFAILSGADSAVQSVKAVIDIGTKEGIKFGYGIKGDTDYKFKSEYELAAEKGRYEKFNMSLGGRKGVIIVHQDILTSGNFLLSFAKNPADDAAKLLGGKPYGLWIEEDWKETVFAAMIGRGYLVPITFYKDAALFNEQEPIHLFEVKMTEEQADELITELLQKKLIRFPKVGNGVKLQEIKDLTDYALTYNEALVEKLADKIKPLHDGGEDKTHPKFEKYARELFPVQAHVSTAAIKKLQTGKSVLIQGEMSTGKSTMMSAVSDGLFSSWSPSGKDKGYHACLMSPPSLMDKWPKEIKAIMSDAVVHVIRQTKDLIAYHTKWTLAGRPKPTVPTFFVISYTTMRDGSRILPAVEWTYKATSAQRTRDAAYKAGYYCPTCGEAHQTIESKHPFVDEDGMEKVRYETHNMTPDEFGKSRRLKKSKQEPNAFCFNCGDSLWTNKVATRYESFAGWSKYAERLRDAVLEGDVLGANAVRASQVAPASKRGLVRKVAAIDYIRRKMKNFFDISIVDEVHLCKADNTAQGNALGSLVASSKKVVAGTGTLFGGKSEDIYYILWRLFSKDMVNSGYNYEDVLAFNQEYGNIESRTFVAHDRENSNTNSRGGATRRKTKLLPGISPFIYGKFMMHNIVNVRLTDVWPDPVELVDMPTIFVPLDEEIRELYDGMMRAFQSHISGNPNAGSIYRIMMDYGIAFPDNPYMLPDATIKNPKTGERSLLWEAKHVDATDFTSNKERKLQEIITTEMAEGRKSIVYVRDTGSTTPERDVRPRLQQKLEEIGAKVCVLSADTVPTDKRSQWLSQKIEQEGYDVCIVSQELVKVGLDLLCTPTLIFYQFSWSLFTINQAARRAWRIGQTQECRLFYIAYENTMQEDMSRIIAAKNRATAAINGGSGGGLSEMLGDEGDLRSLLLKSIKEGGKMKGSSEEWIEQTSDRARAILANVGKKDVPTAPKATITVSAPIDVDVEDVIESSAAPQVAAATIPSEPLDLWSATQTVANDKPKGAANDESKVRVVSERKAREANDESKVRVASENKTRAANGSVDNKLSVVSFDALFDMLEEGFTVVKKIPKQKERASKHISVGQITFDF